MCDFSSLARARTSNPCTGKPSLNPLDHQGSRSLLHSHSNSGGVNGNPLQDSCLERPRTGEPGGLPSTGSQRVRHDWAIQHSNFRSPNLPHFTKHYRVSGTRQTFKQKEKRYQKLWDAAACRKHSDFRICNPTKMYISELTECGWSCPLGPSGRRLNASRQCDSMCRPLFVLFVLWDIYTHSDTHPAHLFPGCL